MRSDTPIQKFVSAGDHQICLHEWLVKDRHFCCFTRLDFMDASGITSSSTFQEDT